MLPQAFGLDILSIINCHEFIFNRLLLGIWPDDFCRADDSCLTVIGDLISDRRRVQDVRVPWDCPAQDAKKLVVIFCGLL